MGIVVLLATGFVDAYVFVSHGHVFAEAMTGNLVLIAVGTAQPGIVAFWRPLSALAAFVAGVAFAAIWVPTGAAAGRDSAIRLSTLIFETVVLAVVGALPASVPQGPVIGAIAFASGLQIATFRRVEGRRVTSTVMTTNTARAIEALATAARSRRAEDLTTAGTLLASVAAFLGGAFAGAILSAQIGTRAGWIVAGLFAFAVVLSLGAQPRPRPGG